MTNEELEAYQVGYNLGWFRALETVNEDLQEIADCILNSATFKQMEEENNHEEAPIFFAKIMSLLAELKKLVEDNKEVFIKMVKPKEVKPILWRAEKGGEYYCIDFWGNVTSLDDNRDVFDNYNYETGNYYRTEEEAKQALLQVKIKKAEMKIKRFIAENDLEFEPNWGNYNQDKCAIGFDWSSGGFVYDFHHHFQYSSPFYFKSSDDAQKVIAALPQELKLVIIGKK